MGIITMDVREAAELLSVSPRTIRLWISQGNIRARLSTGGKWLVDEETVYNFAAMIPLEMVAKLWGKSRRTIYRMVVRGELSPRRLGGKLYFDKSEIENHDKH